MKGGARESKTSPRRLQAAERAVLALNLRKAGVGFERIAQECGYRTVSAAYKAVERALKKTLQEPADELRRLELERLNEIWTENYRSARQGNLGAIDRAVRLMERRAKLLGLDMVTPLEVTGPGGGPITVREVIVERGPDPEE